VGYVSSTFVPLFLLLFVFQSPQDSLRKHSEAADGLRRAGNFTAAESEYQAVLGEAYVANALKNADDFNKPFQELVTEYCWGAVWGREELPRKTRSMLNLAMISILNRPHELRVHIKGALVNGVTKDEIREIFMQVAIYAGVPAGVDSFRIAREVFAEIDKG
jgi:4-carboxymuconolactone decarboxylase